jgi:hemerythrin-like domain-containing protein
MMSSAGHAAILEDFEHIEQEEVGEGIHEKYLAIAEKLAQEMLQ